MLFIISFHLILFFFQKSLIGREDVGRHILTSGICKRQDYVTATGQMVAKSDYKLLQSRAQSPIRRQTKILLEAVEPLARK